METPIVKRNPWHRINNALIVILIVGFSAFAQKNKTSQAPYFTIAYTSKETGNMEIYSGASEDGATTHSTQVHGGYAAWSPNGDRIAFYAKYDDRKTWSIHTMNSDGSNPKRLTHDQNKWDNAPDWSPDGKRIVFAREYKDAKGIWHPEIWIMNADGSQQRQIKSLRGSNPFFTPDGRIVFSWEFEAGRSAISIADVDGTHIKRLTRKESNEWHPEVSPDGKQIAFMSDRDGTFEIYVMDIDGTNQKRLTTSAIDAWYPSWSPDGKQLIYSSATGENGEDRTIYIMNNDGSAAREIIPHGGQAAWYKPKS